MKKEPNTIKKMWHDKRGKAILKLGIWFLFFLLMALVMLIMSVFNKPTNKPSTKNPPIQNEITYLSINEMWDNLENQGYAYQYQVTTKPTSESIIYQGDKTNVDIGFRESKIGIIKYRVEEDHTYQILVDNEIEIPSIYEEGDELYLNLKNIRESLTNIIPEETKSGIKRVLTYQNNDVTTQIITTSTEITSIRITTSTKEYNLLLTIKTNPKE